MSASFSVCCRRCGMRSSVILLLASGTILVRGIGPFTAAVPPTSSSKRCKGPEVHEGQSDRFLSAVSAHSTRRDLARQTATGVCFPLLSGASPKVKR